MEDFIQRKEFNEVTDKLYSKSNRNAKDIAVLYTLFESLKDLPKVLNSLETTMAVMSENISGLNKNLDKLTEEFEETQKKSHERTSEKDKAQDARIAEIDNKTKIDFAVAVKDNWWKIMIVIIGLMFFAKELGFTGL